MNLSIVEGTSCPLFYVYILSLSTGKFYCGITNNIEKRYKEHSQYKKSWASKQGVKKLIWFESVDSRKVARIREKYIKRFGVSKYVLYLRLNKKLL
jgi:putative endonuclease